MFLVPNKFLFLLFIFGAGIVADAQSTLGSINGTIHDGTDAAVPGAAITLHRDESNTDRRVTAGADGSYTALNLEAGTYSVRVEREGFAPRSSTHIHLDPRQQLRLDVDLSPAAVTQTVQVDASDAGTITTDNASISAALSAQDVLNLPANYRGAGSTSPLNVIQTLPGVQPDSGGYPPTPSASPNPSIKFSIQGGLPSQSETTVDGISAQNQTTNNIQADAFPSAESISEIRVDGVNNNAEYGQPGEITTVTKSGTNSLHGSAFLVFSEPRVRCNSLWHQRRQQTAEGSERFRRVSGWSRPYSASLRRPQPDLLLRHLRRSALPAISPGAVSGANRAHEVR